MYTLFKTITTPILFSMMWFLTALNVAGQHFSAKTYRDEPGMVSNRIYDMVQAPNGEMWMATPQGVMSYDGLNWTSHKDGIPFLPHTGLLKMAVTNDSSLYVVGSSDVRFTMASFSKGKWKEVLLPDELKQLPPYDTYYLATIGNTVIFAHESDLYFYRNHQWEHTRLTVDNEPTTILSITPHGRDLTVATKKGLYELGFDGSLIKIFDEVSVYDCVYKDDRIFLLGENWVGELVDNQLIKHVKDIEFGARHLNSTKNILVNGDQLLFSYSSPVYLYDLSTKDFKPIITEGYELDYTCLNALFDQENNLWIATLRGAFKINNLNMVHYDRTYLLEDEVSAIAELPNGEMIFGSNTGFNVLSKNKEIKKYSFGVSGDVPRVMDIVTYRGDAYMASSTHGVVHYHDNSYTIEDFSDDKVPGYNDLTVYEDTLYASSNHRVFQYTGYSWEKVLSLPDSMSIMPIIRKMLFTDQGKFLITQMGLFHWNDDSLDWIVSDKLTENNIYNGVYYKDQLYLGTGNGIRVFKGDQISLPRKIFQPLSTPIYGMLIDRQGNLWAGTDRGIYNLTDSLNTHYWNKNGLAGNEVNRNAFVQLEDGRIVTGTDKGATIYTPKTARRTPVPHPEITKIEVNGSPYSFSNSSSLSYDQNNLQFSFRAISYFSEENINYRVRLKGHDPSWRLLPYYAQRDISYAEMGPGKYQFQVQARIGSGPWSELVSAYPFEITAAFYTTTWFRILVLLFVAVSIYLIVYIRSRQLKTINKLLTNRVAEKTAALMRQNSQLKKTIEDLKQAQSQLIQSEKLASMGHLTSGIAHELNNPLNYIYGGAECIKRNLRELEELRTNLAITNDDESHRLQAEYDFLIKECEQLIDSILHGASKSTKLIKSLSTFTADGSNFYSFVDLVKEVDTALTLLNNEIGFRITINRLYGNIPKVEAYPAKINQLLVNLLLNAIQAIQKTGEITVRTHREGSDHVNLTISDTGNGIDLKDIEQVFEPFFTTKATNPGLGLTIAKSIVQDHNGSITFISTPGEGSAVTVTLPIYQTNYHKEDQTLEIEV